MSDGSFLASPTEDRRLVWTPELIARFWDYHAQHPETYFTNLYGDVIADRLGGLLTGREHVVDYGAGAGFLIPYLLRLGVGVTALDYSPISVAETRRRHGGHPRFEGAFEPADLAATGRTFDAVLCVEVIEHLQDAELDGVLADIARLLTPGGIAIFTTPNCEDLAASEVYCPVSDVVFHRWQHVRSWSRDSLTRCLREHGFSVTDAFETDFSARRCASRHYASYALRRTLHRTRGLPHLVAVAAGP